MTMLRREVLSGLKPAIKVSAAVVLDLGTSLLMMIAVSIVIAAIVVTIPPVVMIATAAVTVPIADKESLAVVARFYPACSGVGWTSPIAVMPSVAVADRVPITLNPYEVRAGAGGNHGNHARRRWSTNPNSDAHLTNRQTG